MRLSAISIDRRHVSYTATGKSLSYSTRVVKLKMKDRQKSNVVFLYDPVFTDEDKALMQQLGMQCMTAEQVWATH
jgi:hypothetical protein